MSRSLGTLTIDLIAKVGGFTAGLTKAERDAQNSARKIQRTLTGLGRAVTGAFALIGGGNLLGSVIRATAEAEESFALLENAVKATGGAAGYTAKQLSDLATDLQRTTTFTDEAIQGAEQLLLRFQNIQGVNFKGALNATLDLATALKKDLNSAALLVGKALADPVKGVNQLARSGIVLSSTQKELIKDLAESGRLLEAQALILQEVEKRFGGAAEAARNSFGGALTNLKNVAGDLLEVKTGVGETTEAVNALADVLGDPRTKSEIDAFFGAIIGGAAEALKAITQLLGPLSEFRERVRQLERRNIANQSQALSNAFGFVGADQLAEHYRRQAMLFAAQNGLPSAGGPDSGRVYRPRSGTGTGVMEEEAEGSEKAAKEAADAWKELVDEIVRADQELQAMDRNTQTSLERQIADLDRMESELVQLREAGAISAETFDARWSEALDSVLTEVEVTAEKIGTKLTDEIKKKSEETNEFWLEASRNTVDIIAGYISTGFDGSFKDVLSSFLRMLGQMASQAAAAQIGKALFGDSMGSGGGFIGSAISRWGSGGGIGGGISPDAALAMSLGQTQSWWQKGLGFLGGLFGFADGGTGMPGNMYRVLERGPELLTVGGSDYLMMGNQSGKVTPMARGGKYEFHFHGVKDADSFRRSQGSISAQLVYALNRSSQRDV